jgi:hypothetical protein
MHDSGNDDVYITIRIALLSIPGHLTSVELNRYKVYSSKDLGSFTPRMNLLKVKVLARTPGQRAILMDP